MGIDRIIAEAQVAKMTLYNHFSSKDELILAVLKYREDRFDGFFEAAVQRRVEEGMNPLEAFFAVLEEWFKSPGFRGCAFINASVELSDPAHPAAQFAARHKRRFHKWLEQLLADSAGPAAVAAAPAIAVVVEGAIVTAFMSTAANPAQIARNAAFALVAQAKGG